MDYETGRNQPVVGDLLVAVLVFLDHEAAGDAAESRQRIIANELGYRYCGTAYTFSGDFGTVHGCPEVEYGRYGCTDFPYFFKGYKENYKQSLLGGIFYTVLFVVMYLDYTVYMTQFRNMQLVGIIMLILLLLLFVSLFNFFSMVVHYHMSIGLIIKNAVLLTLIRPFRVFSTLLGSGLLFYIGFSYPVLFIFFIISIVAWFAFFNFYATFNKMQEQMQKMQLQKEEEEAALAEEKGDERADGNPASEGPADKSDREQVK